MERGVSPFSVLGLGILGFEPVLCAGDQMIREYDHDLSDQAETRRFATLIKERRFRLNDVNRSAA